MIRQCYQIYHLLCDFKRVPINVLSVSLVVSVYCVFVNRLPFAILSSKVNLLLQFGYFRFIRSFFCNIYCLLWNGTLYGLVLKLSFLNKF